MKVSLLTDAPRHNLALMRISAYHKALGDEVTINNPLEADLTYGSYLFDFSEHYYTDVLGGPGIEPSIRLNGFNGAGLDYNLFNIDYSLGYTWEWCPRNCGFCVVPKQNNPREHRSIWSFHQPQFRKICLLNNNTFSDPKWKETFEEIWDADLEVRDESGYDLRLLDDEKSEALKKTKFTKQIHFAWDQIKDDKAIVRGLNIAKKFNLDAMVYVLMGYDTTFEEDLYRCQKIHDFGFDPFPMLYKKTPALKHFRRFIYLRYYRQYPTLKEAWKDYK